MLQKSTHYFQVMIIKRLLAPSQKSFWIALFWTLLIFYLSFKSPSAISKIDFFLADKLVHFSFYFGFVFLWYHYFYYKNKTKLIDKIVLVVLAIAMGIIIEFMQGHFTTTRQADVFDALANSLGAFFGILTAGMLLKKIDTE
ncbi:VanZ family protein [Flavobacterium sp. GCM10023249]|uniref:VanZ family protein n=1 Tax=unclassified Flavobacterium TaxID=196869 RepID=UPI0036188F67